MMSAHADILRWLGGFASPPRRTFIVHGEHDGSAALQDHIERELGWDCSISRMNEANSLPQSEQPNWLSAIAV
jgi:metallo-beta-lactamase family protein